MSKRDTDDGMGIFIFALLAAVFILPIVAAGASTANRDSQPNPARKLVVPFGAIGLTVAAICGWTLAWPIWLSVVLTIFACLALFAAIVQMALG